MDTVKKGKNLGLSEEKREEKREEEKGDEGTRDMEIDLAIVPFEEAQGDPNVQEQEQDVGSDEEHGHEGVNVEREYHTHGAYPTQEGPSFQGGSPAWVVELQASLGEIKQQQAEIIQNQKQQKEYMNHLGDAFHGLRQEVDRLGNFYEEQGQCVERIGNLYKTMHVEHVQQFSNIHADMEGL